MGFNEAPKSNEAAPDNAKEKVEFSEQLDNPATPENQEARQQFQEDFAEKIKDNQLAVTHEINGVEWRYTVTINDNETATIEKKNESEAHENREEGKPEPKSLTRRVTFTRLYADKVIGMKGLLKILQQAEVSEKETEETEEKQENNLTIEGAGMLPISHTLSDEASGVLLDERTETGGQATIEYVPGTLDKPHIAYTATGYVGVDSKTFVTKNEENMEVANDDALVFNIGVGARGVLPLGPAAFYGGINTGGRFEYADIDTTNNEEVVTDTEEWRSGVNLNATAGARAQVDDFRVFVEAQKNVFEGESPKFFGGAGYTF